MQEPEVIFSELKTFFEDAGDFKGKKVLVSAGPTHEPIDPVRFIGNSSSGLMGIEIAKAFADRGANVNLVLGPTHLSAEGQGIAIHPVQTASEMEQACSTLFAESDITIMAAAVAVMKELAEGDVLENCREMGSYFMDRLEGLKSRFPEIVKDVRGKGLMIGMELNRDGMQVVRMCLEKGIIINCTLDRILRFLPPLIIGRDEIDKCVNVLEEIFAGM